MLVAATAATAATILMTVAVPSLLVAAATPAIIAVPRLTTVATLAIAVPTVAMPSAPVEWTAWWRGATIM